MCTVAIWMIALLFYISFEWICYCAVNFCDYKTYMHANVMYCSVVQVSFDVYVLLDTCNLSIVILL